MADKHTYDRFPLDGGLLVLGDMYDHEPYVPTCLRATPNSRQYDNGTKNTSHKLKLAAGQLAVLPAVGAGA